MSEETLKEESTQEKATEDTLENVQEESSKEEITETASELPSSNEVANEESETGSSVDEERELSDEELDTIADTAISVLQDILKYFDIGEVIIDEYEGEEGELILDITGDDLAVLIGRHGATLNALQFLVSTITVRKIGFRYPVVVDVEGYKSRQRQRIEAIARSSADRAVEQSKNIRMKPMSPYERRIVHITLRDDTRVETASEGEGGRRHVVIIPR